MVSMNAVYDRYFLLIIIESIIRHVPPHIGDPLVRAAGQTSIRHCQCHNPTRPRPLRET